MSKKLDKNLSLSRLRNLLRRLGIRSVASELEYALLDMTGGTMTTSFGKPDQILMNPNTLAAFKRAFK